MVLKKLSRLLAVSAALAVLLQTNAPLVMAANEVLISSESSESSEEEGSDDSSEQAPNENEERNPSEDPGEDGNGETEGNENSGEDGEEAGSSTGDSSESGDSDGTEEEAKQPGMDGTEYDPDKKTDEMIGEDPNFVPEEAVTVEEAVLNQNLIERQNIVIPELTELRDEFRFTKITDATRLLLKKGARVYEDMSTTSRVIGRSYTGSLAYVLETEQVEIPMTESEAAEEKEVETETWYYVESGSVRGYVPAGSTLSGEKTDAILQDEDAMSHFHDAECIVNPMDNPAFAHLKVTAYEPVVEKHAAIAGEDEVRIYSQKKVDSEDIKMIGTMGMGDIAYILADADCEMIYVESGDVRGFVKAEDVIIGQQAEEQLKEKEESSRAFARELVSPDQNPALYYTLTSTKEADRTITLRKEMVNFALQFLGNPYVWGGTSLTEGADCSGFVMEIYQKFGYDLPRISADQAEYGMQIPVSAAIPGDLIFFAKDGMVYHVAMYIGDGQVVHAKNSESGIVVSEVGSRAVWATRVIQ